MGQKQSKDAAKQQKNPNNGVMHKAPGTKLSSSSKQLVAQDVDDDVSLSGLDERNVLLVPRHTHNICGVFLEVLVIIGPIDDPMERDFGIFEMHNYDNPDERMWVYIARPEASITSAKESLGTMVEILMKASPDNGNFPNHFVSGRVKRLYFGQDQFQQGEHDPDWIGRVAIITSLPTNGVFLSALLALSPNGVVPVWLALAVGSGLIKALHSLHQMGYIHRYVTPWNFMLLTPFSIEDIVERTIMVDLSLATSWPVKKQLATPFVGTVKYSSKRALSHHNQGPADDFISVIFIVAELISGKLPWRSIKDAAECATMKQKFPETAQYKRLPREIRKTYQMLYRTYGMRKPPIKEVIEAFNSALNRKAPDWRSVYEMPEYLSMPLESIE